MALPSWSAATAQEGNDAPSLIVQTEYDATGVVCNGTNTNQYVPVFSQINTSWIGGSDMTDYSNIASQWIYPRDYFVGDNGIFKDVPSATIKINKITFHASTNPIPDVIKNATVQVRIGEVAVNTIGSQALMNSNRTAMGSAVYSGSLSSCCNGQTMTITLSTPYEYNKNTDKNLIIDICVDAYSSSAATCKWYGVPASSGSSCYYYYYRGWGSSDHFNQSSFLPKMTVDYTYTKWESPETIDFGAVNIAGTTPSKTLQAKINNPGAATSAIMSTTPEGIFAVNPTELDVEANGETPFELTFTPAKSISYSGKLNLVINGDTANVPMKGVGFKAGEKAIRDSAFFAGIEYTWKEWKQDGSGQEHTSSLAEIATNPDQIIAMIRKVYMDRTIPGNYHRGYDTSGKVDTHFSDVIYSGVGRIANSAVDTCANSYGWNIPGNVLSGSNGNYNFRYMDPEQYKPYYEGVTLLLLEIKDYYVPDTISTGNNHPAHDYKGLRDYVDMAIKSARVVTEATRVGAQSDYSSATLFKLDCDKMNKFFLIAKGQLGWLQQRSDNSKSGSTYSFYGYPCYYSSGGGYLDYGLYPDYMDVEPAFMCHMFEQFSPAEGSATSEPLSDGYRMFVTDMKSFGIEHDCPNVPFVYGKGHHFMMYGQDSEPGDCQDIRDMMFIVPDYRMMNWNSRGSKENPSTSSSGRSQDYFNYNTAHQPSIGVFVIRQDSIPGGTSNVYTTPTANGVTGLFKHQLKWRSNLDQFLPKDVQHYELWEIVIDDFGVEHYQPVYYRNAQGQYLIGENEWVSDTTGKSQDLVKIVLDRNQLTTNGTFREVTETVNSEQVKKLLYTDVYVDMHEGSQTKTYVIRGRDADGFLSLQMSNQQEVFIPGTDPYEKARMIGATYYSRYNPQNETNCYSNRLELSNNGMTLTANDLSKPLYFYRSSRAAQLNEDSVSVKTDSVGNILYATEAKKELVAIATASDGSLNIVLYNQSDSTDYPKAVSSGYHAGYHKNSTLSYSYRINSSGYVQFTGNRNLLFWDNFVEDVSKNAHPLQYLYKMETRSETESEIVYLNTYNNGTDYTNGAVWYAWTWPTDGDGHWVKATSTEQTGQYKFASLDDKVIIARMDPNNVPSPENLNVWGSPTIWNQTAEMEVKGKNTFTINGWLSGDWSSSFVYSNDVRVPVYKTDSKINSIISLDEVIEDTLMNDEYSPGDVEFEAKVQMSSKGEILRYDAYRWSDTERNALANELSQGITIVDAVDGEDEDDIFPTGIAGNQGGWYTVSMNDVEGDYYYAAPASAQPAVSTDKPTSWANFIDYYPNDATVESANEYLYAPVVELFTKGYKQGTTNAREDYNSYGGPQKFTATGRMTLKPYEPDESDIDTDKALMSNYKWFNDENGKWYSYYNVYLSFSQLDVPNKIEPGYELYKVRAWRKVTGKTPDGAVLSGEDILGEEISTRQTRVVDGWYMYEDINFGDSLELEPAANQPIKTMSCANLKGNGMLLGHRSTKIGKPVNPVGYSDAGGGPVFKPDTTWNANEQATVESLVDNEMRATFGALRLKTSDDDKIGTLDSLFVEFKVRAYFTKTNNPLITPSRDGATQLIPGGNFDYYVTEGTATFKQKAGSGVITGIGAVIQDVNREVVGVTYVNPIGQMSSMPWRGVNIIVTRYSDGSTTTKKVVR